MLAQHVDALHLQTFGYLDHLVSVATVDDLVHLADGVGHCLQFLAEEHGGLHLADKVVDRLVKHLANALGAYLLCYLHECLVHFEGFEAAVVEKFYLYHSGKCLVENVLLITGSFLLSRALCLPSGGCS